MRDYTKIEDFDLDLLQKDLVVIEDKNTWILKSLPKEHPRDPRYLIKWRDIKRKCIEGYWGKDFDGWRFCPGVLFFYINFATIVDTDEVHNTRKKIRPDLSDLEWMMAYEDVVISGFSGFENDTQFSSDKALISKEEMNLLLERMESNEDFQVRYNHLLKPDGTFKEYVKPLPYLKGNHKDNLGLPLYYNESCNTYIGGSRGGGKSYFWSAGKYVHTLLFDGQKRYNLEYQVDNKTETVVGSGDTDKSSDFVNKVSACINELGFSKLLGAYGEPEDPDFSPNPFYKNFNGSIEPGNKKNPFMHKYKKNINGAWQDGFGTLATLYHVSYSTQKTGGAEAAAGGRYLISLIEEVGLTKNCVEVHNSNKATVRAKKQFGCQVGLGTSGNMDLAQGFREMFHHPSEYDILQHQDIWEDSGNIGFFLPAYLADRQFKDANGNTKLKQAIEYYLARQEKARKSSNPKILEMEKMNYPLVPSQMWITSKESILPSLEASNQERILLADNLYQKLGTPIELWWDSNKKNKINYKALPLSAVNPYWEFSQRGLKRNRTDLEGCIMIYIFPPEHTFPEDLFIFCHDPYVAEDLDKGGSVGVTYGFFNPKYDYLGYPGGQMACSYIGKHPNGLEGYYENQEKLIAMYGNPPLGLWLEADRGDFCRGYYIRKNKLHLICNRPQFEKGSSGTYTYTSQKGYLVGNGLGKLGLLQRAKDTLLRPIKYNGEEKLFIEWIPDIFLIRQIALYTLDGNFDAVSCFLGYALAEAELLHFNKGENIINGKKKNKLSFLSQNKKLFGNIENKNKVLDGETTSDKWDEQSSGYY